MCGKKIYNAWSNMKARCFNKNNHRYKIYGGRGITVCNRWKNSFENFYKDMNKSFIEFIKNHTTRNTTLDRIDNNGNYNPKNCRWATAKQQANNRNKRRKFI